MTKNSMIKTPIQVKNILFDLDGTLADPFQAFKESLNYAFKTLHLPLASDEMVRVCIGPPLHKSLVEVMGFKESDVPEVMRIYRDHHRQSFLDLYKFYNGIETVLKAFSSSAHLFLATSKPISFAAPLIEKHHLSSFFKALHGSELDGTRSDKSELIAYICQTHQLQAHETVMIGDRKYDIIGAKNNHLLAGGVLWGFGDRNELEQAGADFLAETPADLNHLLFVQGH